MFSLLIFSLGLHFLGRPLLTASCNYVMPGHNDDEDEKTQMLIAGNRYDGQLTNCAWWSGDLEVRFDLLLLSQF